MKKSWIDSKTFTRTLEIFPGALAWLFILAPFILAAFVPLWVGVFILVYSFYFLVKALNIARHLVSGYFRMRRNMKVDWLEMCKASKSIKGLEKKIEERYEKTKAIYDWEEMLFVQNLGGKQTKIKNWEDIKHVIVIAVSTERLEITEPTIQAIVDSNYPLDKMMIVFAIETRFKENAIADIQYLKKKFGRKFAAFKYYAHVDKDGEVKGKGPNITSAAKQFWAECQKKSLDPKCTLVTNLDADHIVHPEYFSRLTYLFITDPNRHNKSYQPATLLFNNIWDVPAMNRVAAVSSSFWQIVEGMRSYKMRTFSSHTQSLATLINCDFWSTQTIVEDGHQFWRTYFAEEGDHYLVPMFIPVYQDAVMGESFWQATKNQYLQRRRWAWGISDFPYIVKQCIRHKEIPLYERLIQIFRHFTGMFTWSTSSFVIATAWIPLTFNIHFQDTVLAHNIANYSSQMLRVAWVGIIANVWFSLALMPARPKHYGFVKTLGMFTQWILSPPFAIFLSAMPALESQTRLMFGNHLEIFWVTPKARKTVVEIKKEKTE